jgi:hypothetical protein
MSCGCKSRSCTVTTRRASVDTSVKAVPSFGSGAEKAYDQRVKSCREKIKRVTDVLNKDEKEFKKDLKDWGYVGSLGYVEEQLDEILKFMKG